ncbi:MAG TPA: HD domain-containing protein [Candidatus Paceibacterota bacterium]
MAIFVNYLREDTPLEEVLGRLFADLQIGFENQQAIESFLAPLRDKGPIYKFHYNHTLRVAILCMKVAEFMHLDKKALLYAGLLHDVGKALVSARTLGKTSGWTEKDTREMRPHVMDGYKLIRGRFDFTAEIILWHHRFQAKGYPVAIPHALHPYCLGSKTMIQVYGRILSLCDQFDAFHRVNDKQGATVIPTGEEILLLMYKANPDQRVLLDELYKADIFTTFTTSEEPRD